METINDETMPVVLGADNLVQMADMAEKECRQSKELNKLHYRLHQSMTG